MVSNNICDLAKLRAGALAMFQNGELDGVLSKEDKALLGTNEVQPSQKTTKSSKTTKGKGKAKETPAVDPKVAQLRADYEELNAINHERDLQYRELQAENRRLIKALQDKKAKQTAEAKIAYEKRKAERTPEQQAKIDAQIQKMLDGAKKAREAKKALAGTVDAKKTESSGKPAKPLSLKELVKRARAKKEAPKNVPIPKEKITYGVNKEALKAKEQRAKIEAEVQRKIALKAETEAKYKGDALKAKLKELQNDPVALENAKRAMEDSVAPKTPDELLANLLVKSQAERKKSETWEIAKGIADYNRDIKNAPKREAKTLFNTKQQELRNEINKTFEAPDGTVDEKTLQEHIQTLRDDDLLLAEARDEVANKIAPYSIDSYLAHEIVKKLDAKPKGKAIIDPTVEAVRKALNKTEDPDVLRQKEQRKQDIQGLEEELLAKYDTVDKLKQAIQAVKDNSDLLEETRKLIAGGGFPNTLEQYIAMHQLKRETKPAGMPKKPSDLSKALTLVNRNVEPKEPLAPFSWLSDALSSKDNLDKATTALEGKKTLPSLKQRLGIKSKFKTPIEIQQAKEKAHRKKLDNYLVEKVPNATPRMRKSAVDRLMELYADGRTLTPEQVRVVLKQEMVPSGVTASFQHKLKELQAKIDEVEASNKPEDIKYDEKALLQAKINAELSSLIKPTIADKINANIYLEPLLTVGSAVRDVLGSANAVLSEAYLNTMTRLWLGKTTVKQELANLKNLPENAKVEWGRIVDNWKRAGEYARQGLVVVSHDKVANTKLKPLFAYENKGFGSVKDSIESVGHWFEVAGNFRLNATDMYFMDTTFKHHIAQTIADGLKKDPNFKISKAQVEEAHQYANWAMFKEDNFVTENVAMVKKLLNVIPKVPLGDLLMRYTRTPTNVALRVFSITGLGDLRFIYAHSTKKWRDVPIYEKYNDGGVTKLRPSGKNYAPRKVVEKSVKGMVKLLTSGVGLSIAYGLGNTDVFSTGYTKENSDVEEAKGTRNDVYFNPQALMRFGSFKEEKGDVLVPLSPLLGQHVVGLRAVIRFAKGKDLTEGEKNAFGQAVDALATTLDVAGGTLGDATGITGIKQATKSWDALGGAVVERVPKPFGVGALGRDIATIADDSERVTKAETPINTSVNRLINSTPFKLLLPKKTDITGENPKANGVGKSLGFPIKIAKADPVIKELRQVSRDSGVDVQLKQVDNNFRIGKTLAEDYGIEPQNMKLNAQDFAKWQEIHNNIVYQSVKSVVESKDYKSLTDPLDKADEIKYAKENPFVVIDGKDYTPKELFLEYKLKGRVVKIEK